MISTQNIQLVLYGLSTHDVLKYMYHHFLFYKTIENVQRDGKTWGDIVFSAVSPGSRTEDHLDKPLETSLQNILIIQENK